MTLEDKIGMCINKLFLEDNEATEKLAKKLTNVEIGLLYHGFQEAIKHNLQSAGRCLREAKRDERKARIEQMVTDGKYRLTVAP